MQMPGRDTQRDTRIQLALAGIRRRAIHHAGELVAVAAFCIKQCAWMRQVKRGLSLNKALYIRKMIDVLRHIGCENPVAIF